MSDVRADITRRVIKSLIEDKSIDEIVDLLFGQPMLIPEILRQMQAKFAEFDEPSEERVYTNNERVMATRIDYSPALA